MHLKMIRESKGLTLSKLADISGISVSYLSELEKSKYEATEGKIIRLSLALGCTPNDLLGWHELYEQISKNMSK